MLGVLKDEYDVVKKFLQGDDAKSSERMFLRLEASEDEIAPETGASKSSDKMNEGSNGKSFMSKDGKVERDIRDKKCHHCPRLGHHVCFYNRKSSQYKPKMKPKKEIKEKLKEWGKHNDSDSDSQSESGKSKKQANIALMATRRNAGAILI